MKLITFDQLRPQKGIAYSRDHLRRLVKSGKFPTPLALSEHRIAWNEIDVEEWLKSRPVPEPAIGRHECAHPITQEPPRYDPEAALETICLAAKSVSRVPHRQS